MLLGLVWLPEAKLLPIAHCRGAGAIPDHYQPAWFCPRRPGVFLNQFCSVRKSLGSTAGVYLRLCQNNSNLVDTKIASPIRFGRAPGDRGEDPAQPVFKTDISWRSEVLSD
jgi:hypothetical protein